MCDKKVLLLAYGFPPRGGSGVQRPLKFTKYLPEFGWKPYVVTVRDINYYVYDHSLLEEIPPEAEVIRTESLDPARLTVCLFPNRHDAGAGGSVVVNQRFTANSRSVRLYRSVRDLIAFPDAQAGWMPFAYRAAVKAIRRNKIDAIVACAGPYTSAVLAKLISRRTGVPYVLDFRDSWVDYPVLKFPTRLHRHGHEFLERWTIKDAKAVSVWGDPLRRQFADRYSDWAARFHVVTNGFDTQDLVGITPQPRTEGRRRIVYSGGLYDQYEPNLKALLAALKGLPQDIRQNLEIILVGRHYDMAPELIRSEGLEKQVQVIGYRSHAEALSYLVSADASLLFLAIGDHYALSGKVFEYMMIDRPIIASIEPDGPCADLLRQAQLGDWINHPTDSQTLRENIMRLATAGWPSPKSDAAAEFSRQNQTRRLAGILDSIVKTVSI